MFLAAAKVGGILANDTYPADFLAEKLLSSEEVVEQARDLYGGWSDLPFEDRRRIVVGSRYTRDAGSYHSGGCTRVARLALRRPSLYSDGGAPVAVGSPVAGGRA